MPEPSSNGQPPNDAWIDVYAQRWQAANPEDAKLPTTAEVLAGIEAYFADMPGADTDECEPEPEDEMRIPALLLATTKEHFLLPDSQRTLAWCKAQRPQDWLQLKMTGKRLGLGVQDMEMLAEVGKTLWVPLAAALSPARTIQDMYDTADTAIVWLVENLIGAGTFTLLAGAPKAGKSNFARALINQVLQGAPFLDRPTLPAPVLFYSLEDPENVPGLHFRLMGLPVDAPLRWRGKLDIPIERAFVDVLREDIATYQPQLVVIDTVFAALHAQDTNDYMDMQRAFQPLTRIAQELSVAILGLYHTNKTSLGHAISIMGSAAIRGSTDVNIIYHHDEETGKRFIRSEGRLGEHFTSQEVTMVEGHMVLGDSRFAQDNAALDTAMLDVLTQQGSLNQKAWLDACDAGSFHLKRRAINRLVERGDVQVDSGKDNRRIYSVLYNL